MILLHILEVCLTVRDIQREKILSNIQAIPKSIRRNKKWMHNLHSHYSTTDETNSHIDHQQPARHLQREIQDCSPSLSIPSKTSSTSLDSPTHTYSSPKNPFMFIFNWAHN